MPCTLQPWEIEFEENRLREEKAARTKKRNEKVYGRKTSDARILEEVACSACRTLVEQGKLGEAPEIVKLWWKRHCKKDIKAGRKLPRRKRRAS